MTTIIMLDAFDKQKLLAGEEIEVKLSENMKKSDELIIKLTPNAIDKSEKSLSNNEYIHKLIDEAMMKRDRSIAIYIHPEGTSVNIYPWPDSEDLYQMYRDGKITFNDYRTKMGLPVIKEEDFLKSKTQFNIQFKEEK